MDFNVLNVVSDEGGVDPSKRRKRKKKKNNNSKSKDAPAAAKASNLDTVEEFCLALGFDEDEIAFGRQEMQERGLAYNKPEVVKIYLEVKRQHLAEHRTVSKRKAKENSEANDSPKPSSTSASTSSGIVASVPLMATGANAGIKPQAPASQKNTGQDTPQQNSASEPSLDSASQVKNAEPAQDISAVSTRERLLSVLTTVKEVDAILDGMKMWLQKANEQERRVFAEEDVLAKFFETVLASIVSKSEPMAMSTLTTLKRQLAGLLEYLLDAPANSLAESATSLIDGANQMKGVNATDVTTLAQFAAAAVARGVQIKKKNTAQAAAAANVGKLPVNAISDLNQGASEYQHLEKAIAPAVPQGDKFIVQSGGASLSAGEVGRLFRLRDIGKRAAEIASRCVQLADTQLREQDAAGDVKLQSSATDEVQKFVSRLAEEAQQAEEAAETARTNLGHATMNGKDEDLVQAEAERLAAESQLNSLQSERERLIEELAAVEEKIAGASANVQSLEQKIEKARSTASAELNALTTQAQTAATTAKETQRRLEAAKRVQKFGESLQLSQGQQQPADATNSERNGNDKLSWKVTSALAMDRYLAVEAACISFMKARVDGADSRIAEYDTKSTNLSALGMHTLAQEAIVRRDQETKFKAEDSQALLALTQSATNSAQMLSALIDSNLPVSAIAALHRCIRHLEKSGISISLPGLPDVAAEPVQVPDESSAPAAVAAAPATAPAAAPSSRSPASPNAATVLPETSSGAQVSKKSAPSWGGWGKPQKQASAPSLREILAEEAEKQDREEQTTTAESSMPMTKEEQSNASESGQVDEKPEIVAESGGEADKQAGGDGDNDDVDEEEEEENQSNIAVTEAESSAEATSEAAEDEKSDEEEQTCADVTTATDATSSADLDANVNVENDQETTTENIVPEGESEVAEEAVEARAPEDASDKKENINVDNDARKEDVDDAGHVEETAPKSESTEEVLATTKSIDVTLEQENVIPDEEDNLNVEVLEQNEEGPATTSVDAVGNDDDNDDSTQVQQDEEQEPAKENDGEEEEEENPEDDSGTPAESHQEVSRTSKLQQEEEVDPNDDKAEESSDEPALAGEERDEDDVVSDSDIDKIEAAGSSQNEKDGLLNGKVSRSEEAAEGANPEINDEAQ